MSAITTDWTLPETEAPTSYALQRDLPIVATRNSAPHWTATSPTTRNAKDVALKWSVDPAPYPDRDSTEGPASQAPDHAVLRQWLSTNSDCANHRPCGCGATVASGQNSRCRAV